MSSNGTSSTARSDAEQRVITVTTEAGDPVTFSGNPAELPGARYETREAMRRAGAFKLLVSNNASRLRNGVIAVEDLDSVLIVTNMIEDAYMAKELQLRVAVPEHRDESHTNECLSSPQGRPSVHGCT